jgi:Ricin-type beta-trefoil lectin domain/Carbohydrate binding module (family 35)
MSRRTIARSLIAAAASLCLAVTGLLAAAAPASAATAKTQQVWLTFYGWYDNTPPGGAIAYPDIHQTAGGTGTYADPITFATDKSEAAPGTIVWVPRVGKYFIMEDDCTECDQDWSGQGPDGGPDMWHFDLWSGGQNGNEFDSIDCEDALTQSNADGSPAFESVVINPPSNEQVDSTPLFNSSTNACYGGAQPSSTVGQYKDKSTGTCLDDPGDSSASGTAVDAAACNGSAQQQFTFNGAFMIINNQCVDNTSGSKLVLESCSGGPAEQWSVNPNGTIEDIQTSTKCFRASGSSVTAASCSGSASVWTFTSSTTTPPPTGGNATYEAESATLGGSADANSCAACSGSEKVSSIGGSGGGTVTFTGVAESAAGSYTMTVYYLSVGKAKPAVVTVNGTAQTVTFAETSASSYSVVGSATVTVSLKAGSSNTIEFSGSGTAGAPDLDRVVV